MPPRFACSSLPFPALRCFEKTFSVFRETSNKLSFAFAFCVGRGRGVGATDCLLHLLCLIVVAVVVVVVLLFPACSNSQHSCNFCGKQFHGSDLTSFRKYTPYPSPHPARSLNCFVLARFSCRCLSPAAPDTLSVWGKSRRGN